MNRHRMIERKARHIAVSLLLAVLGGGCYDGTSPDPQPDRSSVTLTPTQTTVAAFDTIILAATVRDRAGTPINSPSVTWTSTDPAVATAQSSPTVSTPGVRFATVLGVSLGRVTITATSGTASATALITVGPPVLVASVTVTPESAILAWIGETRHLAATLRDANGDELLPRPITWSSDNETVATVDPTGLVRAVGGGSATVTATCEGVTSTATITVSPPVPVASVTVTPGSATLTQIGESFQLAATLRDANGEVLLPRPTTWTSDNEAVATVDRTGLVRAVGEGSATVTATSEGVTGTAAITVVVPVASVTVTPGSAVLIQIGQTFQQAAILRDARGNRLLPRPATWSSDNEAVATVDPTGLVSAVGNGSATVTATCEGVSGTAAITVVQGFSAELAFVSQRDGNKEIYGMNVDGSVQVRFTNNAGPDVAPTWSPDGARIAFQSLSIYLMNADDGAQTRLNAVVQCCFFDVMAWSPDGQAIAFTSYNGYDGFFYRHVAVVNVTSGSVSKLAPFGTRDPAWSPDGRKIVFESSSYNDSDLYVVDAPTGGTPFRLTNTAGNDRNPTWSPDGQKVAFVSYRDGNEEIYVMNADGSGQTNLTNNGAVDTDPRWSPDGRKIAFVSSRNGNAEISVMNADGSARINLTNKAADDVDPQWSPDGQKIAFVSSRDGNEEIYVMNADGSAQTNLTNNRAPDVYPRWRP